MAFNLGKSLPRPTVPHGFHVAEQAEENQLERWTDDRPTLVHENRGPGEIRRTFWIEPKLADALGVETVAQVSSDVVEKSGHPARDPFIDRRSDQVMIEIAPQPLVNAGRRLLVKVRRRLTNHFSSLLPWRSKNFVETVLTPAIQWWTEQMVLPVLDEANEEYPLVSRANVMGPDPNLEIPLGSAVLKVMTLPVGSMVIGAGLSVGVSAKGMTVVVLAVGGSAAAMPVIALGAGAVGALMALGATGLWSIKEQVVKRIGEAIIPTLKRSLVGDSYKVGEVAHLSVLRNLQKLIKDRASEMIAEKNELQEHVDNSI